MNATSASYLHRRGTSTSRHGGRAVAIGGLLALGAAACASDDSGTTTSRPVTVTLVAYDSFPTEGTTLNDALESFTARTGVEVKLVIAGDTGAMVSKAVLTAGNPEGDVMWGVDNTLLSRALPAFEPYLSTELGAIDPRLTELVPNGELTPVDFGDVCVNVDLEWFAERGIDPPATFADLVDPIYADLLTVQNPGSSSPGLAFLLATVAEFGADGWQPYWADLRDNGVEVVESWTTAYYERFSGSSGNGPRPLVVSYASSPPAEVIFADPPRDDAPTSAMTATCFRQVEFAGVLAGTEQPDQARQLVDFLASEGFQREVALNLFVWPSRTDVELPTAFTDFAAVVDSPLSVDPADIESNREEWVDAWTQIVVR